MLAAPSVGVNVEIVGVIEDQLAVNVGEFVIDE